MDEEIIIQLYERLIVETRWCSPHPSRFKYYGAPPSPLEKVRVKSLPRLAEIKLGEMPTITDTSVYEGLVG